MVAKRFTKMKLHKYRFKANAISFTNYALFIATTILVLITAHAKSTQLNDNNVRQTASIYSTGTTAAAATTTVGAIRQLLDAPYKKETNTNTATDEASDVRKKDSFYQKQHNTENRHHHQQEHQHQHQHQRLHQLNLPPFKTNSGKHHYHYSQYNMVSPNDFTTVKHSYHSKFTIEQLLNTKFQRKISNDIDMDPCKAGGFMGDIALPDVEDDDPIVAYTKTDEEFQADAPAVAEKPLKLNATFQRELEILKKEVYHEGLQVEEEGMTDIIRKKTKLPSKSDEFMRHHNDPILSANEPVKPTVNSPVMRNFKNEIIGIPLQKFEHKKSTETDTLLHTNIKTKIEAIELFDHKPANIATNTENEKLIKPATTNGFINRFVDQRKIQSDTKDIEDDSGNNFIAERKVVVLPTSQPTQRSTLPNVFSNTGGNGMKLDEIDIIQPDKVVKRRHRRGRKNRRNSSEHSSRVQRLKEELNRPIHEHHDYFKLNKQQQIIEKNVQNNHKHQKHQKQHQRRHQHHHRSDHLNTPKKQGHDDGLQLIQLEPQQPQIIKAFNYSAENIDKLEMTTKHKSTTMDTINTNLQSSLETELQISDNLKHLEKHHRMARAVTAKKERVWDYGVIPYEIDGNFSGSHKALFKTAMRHWENFTCIKFVERDPEIHPNYIVFTVRSCGCCSFVGKRGNGPQAISIGRNCDKFGIIVHELGHVVGFWHEHTRPDREKHVVIEHNNIMKGQDYNFNMLTPDEVNSLGMAYDYDSIMHYARNTFSKGTYLDTILPIEIKGKKRPEIGQRLRLSAGDIAQANLLYKCPMCGRTFQENTGIFASPSYYTAGALTNETENCEWRITATHGERVVLRLENLNIFNNCQTDYLEVRDGYYFKSPHMRRFCGQVNSAVVTTESSRMLLTYVNTHRAEGYRGFKAEFDVICGGELSIDDNEGRLESPNYPLEYLQNKECIWKISVPKGYQVALKFQSFEVENHDSCVYDYVEVRDGSTQDSQLIGVFCGYKAPPNMKSSGNSMYVKFISDTSVQKAGFSAIFMKEVDECETQNHGCEHECINTLGGYECSCHIGYELHSDKKHCEDACGGRIEYPNGTITSPSFPALYPVLKECIWEIIAPANHKISLNFTHFDLEGTTTQQSDCGYDSVTIYSKLDQNRLKRIGTYCGTSIPPTATSEGNALRIEFHSDKSIQRTGFAAVFFTDIDECAVNNGGCQHECQNTIGSYMCSCHNGYSLHENGHDCKEGECKHEISAPFGNIYSPNYPDSYPPNADCVWHFSTTPGHRIKLIFNEFHVESHQECAYDNIGIYDGDSDSSSILGRFCGDKIPYPISSSTNQLYMVLKTDKNKQMSGFAAMHSTSCGGYLRATNQIQQFYSHARFGNKDYDEHMDCEWTIQSPPSSNVQLTFLTFDIEANENCTYDYVQVISGMDDSSGPMYGQYCGNKQPMDIISLTDSLLVRFKTDDTVSMKGFSASYVAVDPFENSEEEDVNAYSSEMATPFPGSLKSIYKEENEDSDDYSDLSENHLLYNSEYQNRNHYRNRF